MIMLSLILITSLEGAIVQEDAVATYELHTTIENCRMYIKPAFEQIKSTPPYKIEVKAECWHYESTQDQDQRPVLEGEVCSRPKDCARAY